MKRDFLSLFDLGGPQELGLVLERSSFYKRSGGKGQILVGKIFGLLFEKPSTRTRVSFEVAIKRLGGETIFLSGRELQLGRGETIEDTGRVLSSYLDALVVRTFGHQSLESLAGAASIPVINALTDRFHPCQILADLLTLRESFGSLAGLPVTYVGDGNNVAHSLILGAAMTGLDLRIASPAGYQPDSQIVNRVRKTFAGLQLTITDDPEKAVKGTSVIYTDVWTSMGQETEIDQRRQAFARYRVDRSLLSAAAPGVRVMHCLPAHRGEEITDEVIDSAASLIWDQAANRLWAQMGLLDFLFQGESS